MRSRIFHILSAVSLVLCVVTLGFWARGLGHTEELHFYYNRWPQANELHQYYASLGCYTNTFRLRFSYLPLMPQYFQQTGGENGLTISREFAYRAGWYCRFDRNDANVFDSPYPRGTHFRRYATNSGAYSYDITVQPWWPVLVTVILPTIWLYRRRKNQHPDSVWRYSLRELVVAMTVLAAGLGVFLWLKG